MSLIITKKRVELISPFFKGTLCEAKDARDVPGLYIKFIISE